VELKLRPLTRWENLESRLRNAIGLDHVPVGDALAAGASAEKAPSGSSGGRAPRRSGFPTRCWPYPIIAR
jgi:hypothetical protein